MLRCTGKESSSWRGVQDLFGPRTGLCLQCYLAYAYGQDRRRLMPLESLRALPGCEWGSGTKPHITEWLQPDLLPGEQEQLKSMGNIVIPAMANLAAQIFAHDLP